MILGVQRRDGATQLGLSVHLHEVHVRPGGQRLLQQGQRHRRRSVHQVPQTGDGARRRLPGFQEPGDHRGNEKGMCCTGFHGADQCCGFRFAGQEGRHAGPDPEECVCDSTHVEKRHGHQVRVAFFEGEGRGQVRNVVDQRALGQLDAFRAPGGARAVNRQGSVVVADLRVGGDRRRGLEQGFVLVLVTAHHDDAVQARDFGADRLDGRLQFLADEQHAGAAVVEDVDEFVPDDPPVDDRGHRAQRGGGQQGFQTRRVVLVQERHTLAPLQADGSQRAGSLLDPRRPLRPRPLPLAEANRYAVGPVLHLVLDHPDECLGSARGRVGWWHSSSADFNDVVLPC